MAKSTLIRHSNWEPERNLNCPTIKEEFLQKVRERTNPSYVKQYDQRDYHRTSLKVGIDNCKAKSRNKFNNIAE